MRPHSLPTKWSALERAGHFHIRRLSLSLAWTTAIMLAALLSLVVLSALPALIMAVSGGVIAQYLGQQWRLRTLRISCFPADLASFHFKDAEVECLFDELAILRYINAWKWRILAATTAVCVSVAALHFRSLEPDLLAPWLRHLGGLHRFVQALRPALPVLALALFLVFKGPTRHWAWQVQRTIEERASASIIRIRSQQEIRGLGAGVDTLWQALGIERQGEYQAAIDRHLKARTYELVVRPEAAIAMQETLLVLGREDLRSLGDALAIYRSAECHVKGVQKLAAALRNPVYEIKTEELCLELEHLRQFVAERGWEDFHRGAIVLESKVKDIDEEMRERVAQGPPVVLAPGSDPYQLLGVSVDTPTPMIRKLRIRLAQLYHPDIRDSAQNSAKMAELNAAYDAVMKDLKNRGRA
jgi:hypothetical protein